jgi:glycosyltransferase involved in cell wall biosynthesis
LNWCEYNGKQNTLKAGAENGHKNAKELREIYNISDVCAVPSRQEAFGLVALEAIACGTPVVASNQGGIPDFVTKEVGTLIETENVEQLAIAIIEIIDKKKKYNSRKLSKHAKNNYMQDLLIDKLIEEYRGAING